MKRTAIISIALFVFAGALLGGLTVLAQGYGLESTVQATGDLLPTSIAGANTIPKLIGRAVAVVRAMAQAASRRVSHGGIRCTCRQRRLCRPNRHD